MVYGRLGAKLIGTTHCTLHVASVKVGSLSLSLYIYFSAKERPASDAGSVVRAVVIFGRVQVTGVRR